MSDTFVTEFSASPQSVAPHDLLARLYREIGISAVAAALDAMTVTPAPEKIIAEDRLPAILRSEDLAA